MDPITIQHLIASVPPTHEIGGVFTRDQDGVLDQTEVYAGSPCVDRFTGKHFRTCSVHLPAVRNETDIQWHSHPKGNRPSSVDLNNSLDTRRQVETYVISPTGAWGYIPVLHAWDTLTQDERRRVVLHWKVVGGLLEKRLQSGTDDAAIIHFQDAVKPYVNLTYHPRV